MAYGHYIVGNEHNADNKGCDNGQRYRKLGKRRRFGSIVLHLFGFPEQHIGAGVDLLLSLIACIVKNDVLYALDAVKEIGVKGRKFRPITNARCFQRFGRNHRYDNPDYQISD